MIDRPKMLWFGQSPTDNDFRETRNRGLILEVVGANKRPDFRNARAAVFWATNQHFESTVEILEDNLVRAIDEGLHLHIVVANDGQRKNVERVLEQKLPHGAPTDRHKVRVLPIDSHEAPNAALLHSPGPAAKEALEIVLPDCLSLPEDHRFLLRRAFNDCKSIKLHLIPGGKSGALTFLIDATLTTTLAGSRPLPFFAKLGKSPKLHVELNQYTIYAEHHIEWHLRPNFQPSRCIYGVEQGILVGNFVFSSRSLWEAAREGQGPQHIRTLFEETLAGWRSQAKKWPLERAGSVVNALDIFFDYRRVPAVRVEAAKVLGGEIYSPQSLWRKLLGLPDDHWLQASIHGDMHGDNVRVRKQDAIVIDFANTTTGPVCADLASLEVWLAFKLPLDEVVNREQWQTQIEKLYHPATIHMVINSNTPGESDTWLRGCLQEIRRIASTSTHGSDEYERVLAVYLLRHACFPSDDGWEGEDEYRRTYAYWLANRLITALWANKPMLLEVA